MHKLLYSFLLLYFVLRYFLLKSYHICLFSI